MYLEHVNLVVKDINKSLSFYQAAFPHWRVRSQGKGEWHGKARTWLHFGDDFQYLALSDHGEGTNRELAGYQVGLAHFAYAVTNLESIVLRLETAGFPVDKGSNLNPFRRNAYFIDPDGFEVEFVEYLSDIPSERNSN